MLSGCGKPVAGGGDGSDGAGLSGGSTSSDSGVEPDPLSTVGNGGRTGFAPQPLPATTSKRGSPTDIARALYGITEPVEGDYTERVQTRTSDPSNQVVLLTQMGLPDDSVRGQRRRLEFHRQGSEWQLEWVGVQVQCWPGRGQEDWSDAPCG